MKRFKQFKSVPKVILENVSKRIEQNSVHLVGTCYNISSNKFLNKYGKLTIMKFATTFTITTTFGIKAAGMGCAFGWDCETRHDGKKERSNPSIGAGSGN